MGLRAERSGCESSVMAWKEVPIGVASVAGVTAVLIRRRTDRTSERRVGELTMRTSSGAIVVRASGRVSCAVSGAERWETRLLREEVGIC